VEEAIYRGQERRRGAEAAGQLVRGFADVCFEMGIKAASSCMKRPLAIALTEASAGLRVRKLQFRGVGDRNPPPHIRAMVIPISGKLPIAEPQSALERSLGAVSERGFGPCQIDQEFGAHHAAFYSLVDE
jgi:hypothetical protein